MKQFTKALLVSLVITLLAAAFAVMTSAETPDLKPGSDTVIFIADGATGNGNSADSPLEPDGNPEGYDPTAEYPKNHLKSSFYQAIDILNEAGGGTLVICGPVRLGFDHSWGNGSTQKDVMTVVFGTKTIKITSKYDGVDYRETKEAKLIIESPAMLNIKGQTIWENIDIVAASSDRCISFNGYDTVMGEGINCYPEDKDYEGVSNNYVSLTAAGRYEKMVTPEGEPNRTTNLIVKSGTYNQICGGNWGVTDAAPIQNVDTNLTLEGTTTVLGSVNGTNGGLGRSSFSGNVNITINGGTYECDIFGGGTAAFANETAKVTITINGGKFIDCWSIYEMAENFKLNPAGYSILDMSNYKGEKDNLIAINNVKGEFTEIKWPEGTPEGGPVGEITPSTEAPKETDAPETKAPETKAPETDNTEATDAPEKDETDAPVTAAEPGDTSSGTGNGLIIGIIAGVVVVAGVVAGVIISKKKGAKTEKK